MHPLLEVVAVARLVRQQQLILAAVVAVAVIPVQAVMEDQVSLLLDTVLMLQHL